MQFGFYSETYQPAVNQAVGDFVSRLVFDEDGQFSRFCTMAVADDRQLVAGVVYHNYQPLDGVVEVSCASIHRKWMSRDIIRTAISMPFEALGCQAVFARHSEANKEARRFWKALGASEHVIPRLRGRDEPAECVAVLPQEVWAESRFAKVKESV